MYIDLLYVLCAFTGENVNKAVEMLLDRVMLRMESLAFPGRILPPMSVLSLQNGHDSTDDRIRLEQIEDKSKCNC